MQLPSAPVVALAAALAFLLPSLLVLDQPAAAVMVIALGVAAAMACLGRAVGVVAARAVVAAPPSGLESRPVPSGHVTDPVHHPLRPRAPGHT